MAERQKCHDDVELPWACRRVSLLRSMGAQRLKQKRPDAGLGALSLKSPSCFNLIEFGGSGANDLELAAVLFIIPVHFAAVSFI